MVYGIVAKNSKDYIGNLNNELPWKIVEDLEFFKAKTIGETVIMGRKTYESIGRPLPLRDNIVLSRDKNLRIDGVHVVNSIERAMRYVNTKDVFIIGGSEIYKVLDEYIDYYYVTEVDFNMEEGVKIDLSNFVRDIKGDWYTSISGVRYRFCVYKRKEGI